MWDEKVCLVIMGFGIKTDYSTNRTLDLDKTYKNIIQPALFQAGLRCIRADEIADSSIIDKSMYALIMKADLVIADITTYNPNVLYELGVRHAVKRYSTIILKEKHCNLTFDLNHVRAFEYEHLGTDIGADEAQRCQKELSALINQVISTQKVDSPLYDYLQRTEPPMLNEREYEQVLGELAVKEKTVFAIVEEARKLMQQNNFIDASKMWSKASELIPQESYFIQQRALCVYKSEKPSVLSSLTDGLSIIMTLNPEKSNDTETLGISGAICRRIFDNTNDMNYLDKAINYYRRGYDIIKDYYTGENYAFCLDLKRNHIYSSEEIIYYKIEARKVRQTLIDNLESTLAHNNYQDKWIYATLANCYYALNDFEKGMKYEKKFKSEKVLSWEVKTFEDSKKKLLELRCQ